MARKLTDIEKKKILSVLDKETDFHDLQTPEEWHQFVMNWNWGDGYEPLSWIGAQPRCDRGTALLLYWYAAPAYFCQYADRDEVERHELDNYDFIKTIEARYLRGFYKRQEFRFDPTDPENTGSRGADLTQEYADQAQKRPLPQPMFEASPGEPVEREDLFVITVRLPTAPERSRLMAHLSAGAAELKRLAPNLAQNASPLDVVDAIRDAVESHRSTQGAREGIPHDAPILELSYIWSDQLRRAYGWQWQVWDDETDATLGVFTPEPQFGTFGGVVRSALMLQHTAPSDIRTLFDELGNQDPPRMPEVARAHSWVVHHPEYLATLLANQAKS